MLPAVKKPCLKFACGILETATPSNDLIERLAEHGWTPHRVSVAQKNYHGLQFTDICMLHDQQGWRGFIEFEISISTIATVFRQPLTDRDCACLLESLSVVQGCGV